MVIKVVLLIALLLPSTMLAEDSFFAGFNYVSQINQPLPIKSLLIHPEKRQVVLGKSAFMRPTLPYSFVSSKGHFKIHYTLTGKDAVDSTSTNSYGVPDFVFYAAEIAEYCYSLLVDTLQLDPPPPDQYDGDQIDFYIKEWAGRVYAETYPENSVTTTSRPYDYTAYTILDNNYEEYPTKGLNGLRVTIAHELFHIIQLGYNWWPNNNLPVANGDAYFLEWNSTWFEEYAFPEINDYLHYLGNYFNYPDQPIYSESYSYALGPFFKMLVDKGDRGFVKRIWERIKSEYALPALEKEVKASLKADLAYFWNTYGRLAYYTGQRYNPQFSLSADAQYFPEMIIPRAYYFEIMGSVTMQNQISPYTNHNYLFPIMDSKSLSMNIKVENVENYYGSYILSSRTGDSHLDVIWGQENFLGKREINDAILLVVTNGDVQSNGTVKINIAEVSDENVLKPQLVGIFPNPYSLQNSSDLKILIHVDRLITSVKISFINLLGQEVFNWDLNFAGVIGTNQITIPGDILASRTFTNGLYVLVVDIGYKKLASKILFLN